MLPVGMVGVYIEPAVGTVPGVGLAVAALPVRNSVCIKLSGSGGSNLGSTGADVEPASLGADSGCEDDTPCMVVIPGMMVEAEYPEQVSAAVAHWLGSLL